jgi:hypothetical protein
MKKQRVIVLLAGLAMIFISAATSYSADKAGEVLAVKKDAYVIREERRDEAKPKMDLLMKDVVETERQSRAKLFFTDDSILNLAEQSRVSVEEYLYSPEKQRSKSIYNLIDGSIKVVVGRSDLEVHTNTAVAAARGTSFLIRKRQLDNEECKAFREKEGITGEIMDRDRECVEACVYVLDGNVEFRLKDIDEKEKPEKSMVTVKEDTAFCTVGDKIFSKKWDPNMLAEWMDEFPVYANTLSPGEEVPAFAPEIPVFPDVADVSVKPPFPEQPEVPEVVEAPEVQILKQGDFERID